MIIFVHKKLPKLTPGLTTAVKLEPPKGALPLNLLLRLASGITGKESIGIGNVCKSQTTQLVTLNV
jgi:hypothetical protein